MKTKITTSFLLLLCLVAAGFGQTVLNSVTTKTYYTHAPDTVSTTTEYADGLGRTLQSRIELGGNVGLVVANLYNAAGRLETVTVPFRAPSSGYYSSDVITAANGRGGEPLAGGKACYTSYKYKPDPLERMSSIGNPGADYSSDFGTHYPRTWYLGTALDAANPNVDKYGFLLDSKLVDGTLDAFETTPPVTTPTHFLTVTKSPHNTVDRYTQTLTDVLGRTLATCERTEYFTTPVPPGIGIRSAYQYDILGNLLFDTLPKDIYRAVDGNMKSEYRYNALGQLYWKNTVDGGTVQYKYDQAGRLWASQDGRQSASVITYTVHLIDAYGRDTAVGVNTNASYPFGLDPTTGPKTDSDLSIRVRCIYDNAVGLVKYAGLSSTHPIITNGLRNLRGRLVAKIAYDESGITSPVAADFLKHVVIEVFTYDDQGRIDTVYTRIPRMPCFSRRSFKYRLMGEPSVVQYYVDSSKTTFTSLSYPIDAIGRAAGKKAGGSKNIIGCTYDDFSRLWKTGMNKNSDGSNLDTVVRIYSLRDWPISISSKTYNIYTENLDYTGNYSGNIAKIDHTQWNQYGSYYTESQSFSYDKLNRLTGVGATVAGAGTTGWDFNEVFSYAADGTLVEKKKGATEDWWFVPKTLPGGPASHQLDYIDGGDNARSLGPNSFVYDANGNMILDCWKKMFVVYDWRNMATAYRFYSTIPTAARNGAPSAVESNIIAGGGVLLSEVRMVYDADGKRVQKVSYQY